MLIGFETPTPEDASDRKLLADVQKFGWHVVAVFDDNDDLKRPDFCFSVGFYANHSHPEVLISGLKSRTAGQIINSVGAYVKAGGVIQPSQRYSEFLDGFETIFRPVHVAHYKEHLGYGHWYYRSLLPASFPALQMVWPDKGGKFPWEQGFDSRYQNLQEQLWHL